MRIGLLIYGSLDTLSGGYLYDRKLVEHLREAGDSVEIVSLPWRSYPAHLADNLSLRLFRRLRDLPVDILLQDELNHPSLALVNWRLRRLQPRYPLISIVHHLRSSEQHPRRLLPLYRAVERAYLRTVDGFIFNSRTTRQAVAGLRGESEEERGERENLAPLGGVIAYPAADHLPTPDGGTVEEMIRGRGSDAGPLRILFVGNLIARKGLHHLIAALSRVPTADWLLDVVGDETVDYAYAAALRSQIDAAGLKSNIRLYGRVSDDELAQRYRAAHLLAVLSYEGFGIVYLEAMAFGLPVLAGVHGAAGEIVDSGVNGFLVEPADVDGIAAHLSALAGDRVRLAALGRNARQRFASHPSWADSAAAVRAYLATCVQ
ncbi:MAG: glycosyltransferase family 4 protein [Caldilineaceae bacterium SB0670_bin_27]|uniref:Glycosyltransferase family 4 protein n=1 Tax=Caldilineaceae bacterium SB0664_bin_27 TaxID=2605260 RepID=A0A6B0YXV8_9CHLR|nr:glycosyltransferase family 4 protein [Caldilineaceae bacterium SB0664_bin_27]MYJ80012.1 glycosyltransferase family 4 protein [Caldilineaceae bacterium SB0670_bin_27]